MNDAQNSIIDMAGYVCDHICHALNMAGIEGSIRCGDCQYRAHEEETDTTWCRLPEGLDGNLEEKDGCSRGRKVSDSDT